MPKWYMALNIVKLKNERGSDMAPASLIIEKNLKTIVM